MLKKAKSDNDLAAQVDELKQQIEDLDRHVADLLEFRYQMEDKAAEESEQEDRREVTVQELTGLLAEARAIRDKATELAVMSMDLLSHLEDILYHGN